MAEEQTKTIMQTTKETDNEKKGDLKNKYQDLASTKINLKHNDNVSGFIFQPTLPDEVQKIKDQIINELKRNKQNEKIEKKILTNLGIDENKDPLSVFMNFIFKLNDNLKVEIKEFNSLKTLFNDMLTKLREKNNNAYQMIKNEAITSYKILDNIKNFLKSTSSKIDIEVTNYLKLKNLKIEENNIEMEMTEEQEIINEKDKMKEHINNIETSLIDNKITFKIEKNNFEENFESNRAEAVNSIAQKRIKEFPQKKQREKILNCKKCKKNFEEEKIKQKNGYCYPNCIKIGAKISCRFCNKNIALKHYKSGSHVCDDMKTESGMKEEEFLRECNLCKKKFSYSFFKTHFRICSGKNAKLCGYCDKFVENKLYEKHIKKFHSNHISKYFYFQKKWKKATYDCPYCTKSILRKRRYIHLTKCKLLKHYILNPEAKFRPIKALVFRLKDKDGNMKRKCLTIKKYPKLKKINDFKIGEYIDENGVKIYSKEKEYEIITGYEDFKKRNLKVLSNAKQVEAQLNLLDNKKLTKEEVKSNLKTLFSNIDKEFEEKKEKQYADQALKKNYAILDLIKKIIEDIKEDLNSNTFLIPRGVHKKFLHFSLFILECSNILAEINDRNIFLERRNEQITTCIKDYNSKIASLNKINIQIYEKNKDDIENKKQNFQDEINKITTTFKRSEIEMKENEKLLNFLLESKIYKNVYKILGENRDLKNFYNSVKHELIENINESEKFIDSIAKTKKYKKIYTMFNDYFK